MTQAIAEKKPNGQVDMNDAIAAIRADEESRLTEFQTELQALQNRLGVRLEIHQLIVPVLTNQDRR